MSGIDRALATAELDDISMPLFDTPDVQARLVAAAEGMREAVKVAPAASAQPCTSVTRSDHAAGMRLSRLWSCRGATG
jgi:hypothetical protein